MRRQQVYVWALCVVGSVAALSAIIVLCVVGGVWSARNVRTVSGLSGLSGEWCIDPEGLSVWFARPDEEMSMGCDYIVSSLTVKSCVTIVGDVLRVSGPPHNMLCEWSASRAGESLVIRSEDGQEVILRRVSLERGREPAGVQWGVVFPGLSPIGPGAASTDLLDGLYEDIDSIIFDK